MYTLCALYGWYGMYELRELRVRTFCMNMNDLYEEH